MENIKHKITEICPTRMKIDVEVPKETVIVETEKMFQDLQKTASVSGFRAGKVPMEIIRTKFEQNVIQRTKEHLIFKTLPDIMKLKKINNTIPPVIEKMDFSFGMPFNYSATVEFHPQFTAKNYRGLKLRKEIKKVGSKDIEEVIEKIRKKNIKLVETQSSATAGDCAVISYRVFSTDRTEIKELGAENQLIDLSEKQSLPGLAEALIGTKKDDKKEFSTRVPDNYQNKAISGKEIILYIEVKGIKEKVLPELNDEFAKEVGAKNVDDLQTKISKKLSFEYEEKANASVEEQIINQLIEQNQAPVPESLVEAEKNYLLKIAIEKMKQQGYAQDFIDKQMDLFEKKAKEEAERQIKLSYILDSIAQQEKIEVSEDEFNQKRMKTLQMNPDRKDFLEKYFEKEQERLISKMKTNKIFDFLVACAKIKTVEVN